MTTLKIPFLWPIQDKPWEKRGYHSGRISLGPLGVLGILLVNMLALFLFAGSILQLMDPAAGILDIGMLSVLLLGLIGGLVAILCSLWLLELLWQPFQTFRKQFSTHFNQLTSWQQCILYFSVFFLLLYAVLWGLAMCL
ncbi:hypothetical protein G5B30_15985 [Sphingobacterium sp. SGG-5]|uniref:hypothetical protein n=1 Tax=Sphingobacterium sp. SGG-5 TaxID=2710881 RepID=UPI0013ED74C2|nr:hypothetical protein [Sphingobacterium sp. SGG-5]NGM63411.1 hypothetical protein [Sphingobacterium sp. SGG-5]